MDAVRTAPPATEPGTTPTVIKWEIINGSLRLPSVEVKCVCALRKALKEHLDRVMRDKETKTLQPAKNNQYFVSGKEIYIESCIETKVGNQATCHAKGRAEFGQINMSTDELSNDMVTFDITYRDSKDELGLYDVELVNGSIEALPRGSRLTP